MDLLPRQLEAEQPSNDSQAPFLLSVCGSLTFLAVLLFGARLWSRMQPTPNLHLEDWTAGAATVCPTIPPTLHSPCVGKSSELTVTAQDSCHSHVHHRLSSLQLRLRTTLHTRPRSLEIHRHAPNLHLPSSLELVYCPSQDLSCPTPLSHQRNTSLAHISRKHNRPTRPHSNHLNILPVPAVPPFQHILGPECACKRECGVHLSRSHHWQYCRHECYPRHDRPRLLLHTHHFHQQAQ